MQFELQPDGATGQSSKPREKEDEDDDDINLQLQIYFFICTCTLVLLLPYVLHFIKYIRFFYFHITNFIFFQN